MNGNKDLSLSPKFGFWLSKYVLILLISSTLSFVAFSLDGLLSYCIFGFTALIWSMLFYTYFDLLFFTQWVVTEKEILIKRGIFYSRTDYLELYRVIDYAESQTFLQMLLKNKTVEVSSGDKSHPMLFITGIDSRIDLIPILRERAESQKRQRGIYEITNQF